MPCNRVLVADTAIRFPPLGCSTTKTLGHTHMAISHSNRWQLGIAAVGLVVGAFPAIVISPVDAAARAMSGKIELVPVTALLTWYAILILLLLATIFGAIQSGRRQSKRLAVFLFAASVAQVLLLFFGGLHS